MTSFYAKTRASWRRWLTRNHAKADAVQLVFYRKATGTPCVSYDEAVEEALCFGWIDGVRHKLDDQRYTNRFTPRKAKSNWSAINKARVERLERDGLLQSAGRRAAKTVEALADGERRPNA